MNEKDDVDELGVQYPEDDLWPMEIAAGIVLAVFAAVVVAMIVAPLWRMFSGS